MKVKRKVSIDLSELSIKTRQEIAIETTDIKVLQVLAADDCWLVRKRVLSNKSITPEIYKKLSNDPDLKVREELK